MTAQPALPQVVLKFDDALIARLLLDVQATWQTEAGTSYANARAIVGVWTEYRAHARWAYKVC